MIKKLTEWWLERDLNRRVEVKCEACPNIILVPKRDVLALKADKHIVCGSCADFSKYLEEKAKAALEHEALIERVMRRVLKEQAASPWRPIAELDRTKMGFYLVRCDGAVRAHLWNPYRSCWERPYPIGSLIYHGEPDGDPEEFCEIPD